MGQVARVEVVEYTDVMCSWAWGSEPKLRLLRWRYEDRCNWRQPLNSIGMDKTRGFSGRARRSKCRCGRKACFRR